MSSDLLALIRQTTRLKLVARGFDGPEYAGPCPFCGGSDRFRVWPDDPEGARWHCMGYSAGRNGCDRGGDLIAFRVEIGDLSPREAGRLRHNREGSIPRGRLQGLQSEPEPDRPEPPPAEWREQARAFVSWARDRLFDPSGRAGLEWLHGRGLTDDTIRTWGLGWHDRDRWRDPHRWGLDGSKRVWLPRGVVIPWHVDGEVWHVKVRRFDDRGASDGKDWGKYAQVRGGVPTLYGLDLLADDVSAVAICEGELDAPLLWQKAGDLASAVAIGSKGVKLADALRARLLVYRRWLIALDRDADREAAAWTAVTPRARRMRPLQGDDVTEFYQAGGDLRAWVSFHLGEAIEERAGAARPSPRSLA